jgi:dihydroorotase
MMLESEIMKTTKLCGAVVMVLVATGVASVLAQPGKFDLLIRGGHVIDSKNAINSVMDVGITGGKIAEVSARIEPSRASRVADATGLYVVPGLIDIHTHVFYGTENTYLSNGHVAVQPDAHGPHAGVTTVVDVGGAGWRNFDQFKRNIIDRSLTRVLSFINIVGSGMKGGPFEQDLSDMNASLTAMRIREHPGVIVGIKTAHYRGPEWDPVDRAVEAGKLTQVPVMVDFGDFRSERPFEDLVLKHLRPGDIYTHTYLGRLPMFDQNGKIRPFLFDAQKRGVNFDVGHGSGSFLYSMAEPATAQGFWPDTISTDLHAESMIRGMKDMTNVMSKFLNLGMSLQDAIAKSTWKPAQVIKRIDLGHLTVGAPADVAVLRLHRGNFGFVDVRGGRKLGTQKLEAELTVREGRVVWDLNGMSTVNWQDLPQGRTQ